MRFVITALALVMPGLASAQAELPPGSFTGSQYVDSNGCVYVRAAVNGGTAWALRVDADRQPVCGFEPTDVGAGGDPEPVRAAAPAPAPQPSAPATAAAPRRGHAVTAVAVAAGAPPGARIVRGVVVPPDYRSAWEDDRVNPDRGPRLAVGDTQMNAFWTETVPRRAIVEIDRSATLRGPGPAYVEAGRYGDFAAAEAAMASLPGLEVQVAQGTESGQYRLLIGPYGDRDLARQGLDAAHAAGLSPLAIRGAPEG